MSENISRMLDISALSKNNLYFDKTSMVSQTTKFIAITAIPMYTWIKWNVCIYFVVWVMQEDRTPATFLSWHFWHLQYIRNACFSCTTLYAFSIEHFMEITCVFVPCTKREESIQLSLFAQCKKLRIAHLSCDDWDFQNLSLILPYHAQASILVSSSRYVLWPSMTKYTILI